MAEAESIQAAKQLEAALKGITVADGYFTDAGKNVIRGFLAHAVDSDDQQCPFYVIQPNTESTQSPHPDQARVAGAFIIFVVDKVDKSDRLQAAVRDLRAALKLMEQRWQSPLVGALDIQPAQYNPEPDSNYALAALPAAISYIEQYQGD
ncbi:MAG: hypothetical protein CME59_02140 [Halioglobus sp.]|nr:hypothetical protein [Halioglobus sp.]|tara:strand:- start:537 stop:986 length:450 start_codon:yes stop_codon:yes gene_type:complete